MTSVSCAGKPARYVDHRAPSCWAASRASTTLVAASERLVDLGNAKNPKVTQATSRLAAETWALAETTSLPRHRKPSSPPGTFSGHSSMPAAPRSLATWRT